ncbi:enhancer of split mbeta protein-like [Artemia franciscana]|uniref:Uncharacterized protein n=1 Tax=Artemia franciscana TaxID=6661 RepID=A0AA88KYI8_ARTSF|nr:hypothetical protein QYM36_013204 [Artemia franciscana]
MAPHYSTALDLSTQDIPISRTVQYKKVTKPMLERQRRARINRCLDELKDLMAEALVTEGENVTRLEKADILELTVNHLQKLRRENRIRANPMTATDRFRAGFTTAAREVSVFLAATPGVDISLGTRLLSHLGHTLNTLNTTTYEQYPESPLFFNSNVMRPSSHASSGYGSLSEQCEGTLSPIPERLDSPLSSSSSSIWRPW